MEDDEIKKLFETFNPELSSSFQFMKNLQRNMAAVEFVRQQQAMLKKRNRVAVVIASTCGLVAGVILTLIFPFITSWISTMITSLNLFQGDMSIADYTCMAWILTAAVCLITAISAYEIAMSLGRSRSAVSYAL